MNIGAQPPTWEDYPDTGCDRAKSCLNCPFPQCKYDLQQNEFSRGRMPRLMKVEDFRATMHLPLRAAEQQLHCSTRTLKRGRAMVAAMEGESTHEKGIDC